MKVLITGGSGFLGQHFIKYLETRQAECNLEIKYTYHDTVLPESLEAQGVKMDLLDMESVKSVLKEFYPDLVVHTAACSSPAFCAKNPDKAMAVNAPECLLVALQEMLPDNPEHLNNRMKPLIVYLSTDQVYEGKPEEAPYSTLTTPVPINTYGVSKLEFENMLRRIWNTDFIILRSSNMIGPPSPYTNIGKFLQWLQNNLSQDKALDLFQDEVRSYIHVFDVCEVICLILDMWANSDPLSLPWGQSGVTYNMGGGEPLSRVDIAHILATLSPEQYPVTLASGEQKVKPSKRAELDEVFGYTSPLDISMDSSVLQQCLRYDFRALRETMLHSDELKPIIAKKQKL
mmetsp:Transcript_41151/g.53075  ORF Transcript_41151/g.53075 Transcript_41151/m.53075 type:complete len:345 (-) Transcript_41151:203-1237(-)